MSYLKLPGLIVLTTLFCVSSSHAQCPDYYTIDGEPDPSNVWGQAEFGTSVSGAGDVDNDGVNDFVVGAPGMDGDHGKVYVFSGRTGDTIRTISPPPLLQQGLGAIVSAFGDLNDDGYGDILIGGRGRFHVISGADGSELREYLQVGTIANAGDVNRDGYDDVVIGDWGYSCENEFDSTIIYTQIGRVFVLSGWSSDTLHIFYNTCRQINQGDSFGWSVASAGDFNNDGYDDIIVGSPRSDFDFPRPNYGKAIVYSGKTGDTLMMQTGTATGQLFGGRVAGAGDLDSDGYDDVLIGVTGGVVSGSKIIAYSGRTRSSMYTVELGSDFAGVGDLNHDGYGDFMVGAYALNSNTGRIRLHSGIDGSVIYTRTGSRNSKFGFSLAPIGDIDNDGQNEIVVGAPFVQLAGGSNNPTGRVYLLDCAIPDSACNADSDADSDGIGDLCDNCVWGSNPGQEDVDRDGVGDRCEGSRNVSEGSDVKVSVYAAGGTVSLSFDQVQVGGTVETSISTTGPATEAEFIVVPSAPPKFYDLTTDIEFSGAVTISISYDDAGMTAEDENAVMLLHYNGTRWTDITIDRSTEFNWIKGQTTTLSPFTTALPGIPTNIAGEGSKVPTGFDLNQNYPNPFNPVTAIQFSLPRASEVKITIVNVLGRHVRTLTHQTLEAGTHSVLWDGLGDRGSRAPSGIYFYRITAGAYTETKRMLLLR